MNAALDEQSSLKGKNIITLAALEALADRLAPSIEIAAIPARWCLAQLGRPHTSSR